MSTPNKEQIFERYELKYILTPRQKASLLSAMKGRMSLDKYGRTTIRNIYYDTPDARLVRESNDKPVYKEKLRVRSYRQVSGNDEVFVELKKKYEDIVYKRRITMTRDTAERYLARKCPAPEKCQIADEIDYFLSFYGDLEPAVFLSYEREAYFAGDGSDLRITLDENILYRRKSLSLGTGPFGVGILSPGTTLLEIKTSGAMPLWLVRVLSGERIMKTSFSKYGVAYEDIYRTEHAAGQLAG